jgi:hypothetical protein
MTSLSISERQVGNELAKPGILPQGASAYAHPDGISPP